MQLAGVADDGAAHDELRAAARVPRRGVAGAHGELGAAILRPDGRVVVGLPSPPVHLVSRPVLHAALLDGLPAGTVEWSTPVRDLADLPEADVVVGADGIHSVVRAAVTPVAPRPLGTVALRGTVPGAVASVTETWGRGRIFGITPQAPDSTNWFACFRADLLDRRPAGLSQAQFLGELYRDWHPAVRRVVGAVTDDGIDRRTLLDLPPLPTYVDGRHVLVGDAAHAMAPNLGRGACESLVDAVCLADALAAASSVEEGLRRYDSLRRRRTRPVVRLSRLLNRVSTTRLPGRRGPVLTGVP
ncbi:FAD-dependent monooxygenase [Georgenia sp. SUBG003]|uniref:FAD-dependent monooxygenase n=1 Tax=Georgenia sp. SUBG003 TaxID=1497974 RepID=UPI003AB41D23